MSFLFFFGLLTWNSPSPAEFLEITDQETIEYLYQKAVRISGLDVLPISQLPPLYSVSPEELHATVCPTDPENCRGLAAVFDDLGYRIMISSDFEISSNFKPFDYSFAVHEIVHALQYRKWGAEIFNGCDRLFETEDQAYRAQDRYLAEEGAFQRLGPQFRMSFYCEEAPLREEYLRSQKVWEERLESGFWNSEKPD